MSNRESVKLLVWIGLQAAAAGIGLAVTGGAAKIPELANVLVRFPNVAPPLVLAGFTCSASALVMGLAGALAWRLRAESQLERFREIAHEAHYLGKTHPDVKSRKAHLMQRVFEELERCFPTRILRIANFKSEDGTNLSYDCHFNIPPDVVERFVGVADSKNSRSVAALTFHTQKIQVARKTKPADGAEAAAFNRGAYAAIERNPPYDTIICYFWKFEGRCGVFALYTENLSLSLLNGWFLKQVVRHVGYSMVATAE